MPTEENDDEFCPVCECEIVDGECVYCNALDIDYEYEYGGEQ